MSNTTDNPYIPGVQDYTPEIKTMAELVRRAIDQWIRCNLNVWVPAQITKVYNNICYLGLTVLNGILLVIFGHFQARSCYFF